jgi:addiction module RelE/StbE family toxin
VSVVWAPQAIEDIARITSYIAAENPVAAVRVARELLVAGDSLTVFPRRGRPSSLPGRRELVVVRPYVIVYRLLADDTVDILRIWHAAQERP